MRIMGKLLACDLDGTLFFPKQMNRCISKKNISFLQKWVDNGNKLLLVTSRSKEFCERLKKEIERPFDLIACTSSQIFKDGEQIRNCYIDGKEAKKLLKILDERYKPLAYLLTTENYSCIIHSPKKVNIFLRALYKLWWFFQFKYREPYIIDDEKTNIELENGKVFKIMVFFGLRKKKGIIAKEINKELRENFPEIESSWTMIVNELTPKNCNKADGINFYANYCKFDKKDIYVVGDSGNDIAMFKEFPNNYCMMHAYPSVKKYASNIITRVYKLDELVLKGETKND